MISPLLEIEVPVFVYGELCGRGFEVGVDYTDGRFTGRLERPQDIGPGIGEVGVKCKAVGVVVLVGRPFYDVVACFLKGRNNNFDTAKDRWMREDLARLI